MRRARGDDGFTLVEVLVAFAIVALALTGLYATLGNSARSMQDIGLRDGVAAEAQSHLDRLVVGPLTAGETTGRYASGVSWRVVVTPLRRFATNTGATVAPARVVLTAIDSRGRTLIQLETFAMLSGAP